MFAKTLFVLFSAAAVSVSAAPASKRQGSAYFADVESGKPIDGGQLTFYNTEENDGACGWFNHNSEHVVAVNSAQFEAENMCGKYVEVHNKLNDKTLVAQIVDECPTCNYGDLDLSEGFYDALVGDRDVGVAPIDFKFLPLDYQPNQQ